MSRLFFQQLPIIMALTIAAPAASDKMSSNQLPSNNLTYHKFLETGFEMLPNSNADDALLNRLQKLVDAYPTYVTLATAENLFNVDGQQQSYALIIEEKQAAQDIPDFERTDTSSTQLATHLELKESSSNIRDVVSWFYHFIENDDVSVSGATSTKEETAQEEEEVSSTTTAHRDIILSAANVGRDELIGLAEVMLQAANCESTNANYGNNGSIDFISDRHLRCRSDFREAGIDSKVVEWLANVVFTRRTIILPSAATQDSTALHHSRLHLFWLVVACVSLLLTVTIMTVSRLKRKHRSRLWLEVEANRRVAEEIITEPFQADFTRELTSFDEELTVQLIEPSRSVILL